jgi:hypothetical protein
MLVETHLYNPKGEWIGWLSRDGNIYSVVGLYVGWLSRDFRILRKRALDSPPPPRQPPARPPLKIQLPTTAPLPPLMSDLPYDTIDVCDDAADRLHTVDDDPDAKDMD